MSVPERSVATRILVLQEHPLLRNGMTDFLNAQPDLQVCGETDNMRDARNEIAKSKPHLLVIALRLGAGDSLEFVIHRFPLSRFAQIQAGNQEGRKSGNWSLVISSIHS
jgi:chemotaxis response regulator CheB